MTKVSTPQRPGHIRSPRLQSSLLAPQAYALVASACLVALAAAGCTKKSTKPGGGPVASLAPSTGPSTEPTSTVSPPPPDTTLRIEVKRINAQSWWKTCLDAWVAEYPKSRVTIGCNTDTDLMSKRIEIPGSTKQCNTVALAMTVYRNTEPCREDARTCQHETTPMHVRNTSEPKDVDFFRSALRADLKWPFAREDLKVVRIPAAEQANYGGAPAGASPSFVVFFEDQTNKNFMDWKNGADADTAGIDYFDYAVEFSAADAPVALQGSRTVVCPVAAKP